MTSPKNTSSSTSTPVSLYASQPNLPSQYLSRTMRDIENATNASALSGNVSQILRESYNNKNEYSSTQGFVSSTQQPFIPEWHSHMSFSGAYTSDTNEYIESSSIKRYDTYNNVNASSSGYTSNMNNGYTSNMNNGYTSNVSNGYTSNVNSGYTSNMNSGFTSNVNSGYTSNMNSGYTSNMNSGYTSNVNNGYTSNVNSGYTSNVNNGNSYSTIDSNFLSNLDINVHSNHHVITPTANNHHVITATANVNNNYQGIHSQSHTGSASSLAMPLHNNHHHTTNHSHVSTVTAKISSLVHSSNFTLQQPLHNNNTINNNNNNSNNINNNNTNNNNTSNNNINNNNTINNNSINNDHNQMGVHMALKYVPPRASSYNTGINNTYNSKKSDSNEDESTESIRTDAVNETARPETLPRNKSSSNEDDRTGSMMSETAKPEPLPRNNTYTSQYDKANIKSKTDVVSSVCPPSLQPSLQPLLQPRKSHMTLLHNSDTGINDARFNNGTAAETQASSHTASHKDTHINSTNNASNPDSDSDKAAAHPNGAITHASASMLQATVPVLQTYPFTTSPKWVPTPVMDFSGDMSPPLSSIFKHSHA